jgi:Uma2 family endonuclease
MSAALKHPPARMTIAEFLDWSAAERSGTRWQLVDGEPVAVAPASDNHGALQSELAYLLTAHLIECCSPCRVVSAPGIVPHVRETENWRIPDLAVTCTPPHGSPETPDPVLLIEILSPSNYRQTRANVWAYTTIPSVREILVVHGTRIEAEVLRRGSDGHWPAQPLTVMAEELLALDSLGFTLPLRSLYRTTSLLGA